MLRYRLFAAVAAGLIALAGVLTVTAGGTPPVPPPVALRGATPITDSVVTDGLEFVPPTVVEWEPAAGPPDTSSGRSTDPTPPPTDVVASPDVAESPEETASPDVASADSPDEPEPASADSVDSLDSADSPDD